MKKKYFFFLEVIISLALLPWTYTKKSPGNKDPSPAAWSDRELKKYSKLKLLNGIPGPPVEAGNGRVVGTFDPLAIRTGVEVLKKGRNAVDAALTTSLAQFCLLEGFIIFKMLAVRKKSRDDVIARFPGTKKILTKENGELYKEGDLLKRPQVAQTLRREVKEGVDYMYRGEWSKKFVRAGRNKGGKITLKDLDDYKVLWSEPAHTTYREYDIFSLGAHGYGSVVSIGALLIRRLKK
jgi:gamma-glutamyltranspeptidase